MNRYMVFAGKDCYPSGGSLDLIDSYCELSICVDKIKALAVSDMRIEWAHIFDTQQKEIIAFVDIYKHKGNLVEWTYNEYGGPNIDISELVRRHNIGKGLDE